MRYSILVILVFLTFQSCKKTRPVIINSSDFVIVETNSKEFPLMLSHEDGELFSIRMNTNTDKLNGVYYSKDETNYFVETNEDGFPVKGIVEDYLIFFDNYTDSTVDIAILSPDKDESQIFREIDISSIREVQTTNKSFTSNKIGALKAAGLGVSIFNCALSSALAVGTGGLAAFLAGVTCTSAIVSIASTLTEENKILDSSSNALSLYSGSLGCALTLVSQNPLDCIGLFIDVSNLISEKLDSDFNTNSAQTDLIQGALRYGSGDIQVTLTWSSSADLDLYVVDPQFETIYYQNPTSVSGGQLDIDDVDGFGPENIFWTNGNAPTGNYTISVNHFEGVSPTNFSVRLEVLGQSRIFNGSISSNETVTIITFNPLNGIPSSSKFSIRKSLPTEKTSK